MKNRLFCQRLKNLKYVFADSGLSLARLLLIFSIVSPSSLCFGSIERPANIALSAIPVDRPLFPQWDQFTTPGVQDGLDEVIGKPLAAWEQRANQILPFQKGPHWARLKLQNDTGQTQSIVLEEQWAPTNYLDIYVLHNGQVLDRHLAGDYRPPIVGSFPHRYPAFTLHLVPGESVVYVRYETDDIPGVRIALWQPDAFEAYRIAEMLGLGVTLGILVVMALYNFIIYAFVRFRAYLHYACYVSCFLGFEICIQGLCYMYIWSSSQANGEATIIWAMLALTFAVQFTAMFLDLPKNLPRMQRYGRWIQYLCWFNIVLTCFHLQAANILGILVNLAAVSWILFISSVLALRRHMQAYVILCAWWVFLFCNSWSILYFIGVVPPGYGGRWMMLLGADFEVITLSLGLAQHMARLRREKMNAEVSEAKVMANIETAIKFQETLLGPSNPISCLQVASYFQPAERIGGDWYDIASLGSGRYAFLFVGDVTGHGFSSTLLSSAVSGCIRSVLYSWADRSVIHPEEALLEIAQRANRLVCDSGSKEGWLMSMIMVCLDLRDLKAYYLNAGHPHPYHTSAHHHFLISRGSLLGAGDDPEFEVRQCSVQVGDTLTLYTDGLLECLTKDKKFISQRTFAQKLAHDPQAESIVAAVRQSFDVSQGPLEDDITVLSVQIRQVWDDHKTQAFKNIA